ncbi:hypothetical protein NLX83_20260 [Allokutzneria sp. A3M-2-11 16]|uniref:hypothetical protein n=1 Tax=Allokutzneria sp. A3M-2-11 16 TaxID=2962043 RepID=UPI0020B8441F|nr:hypothetical protein [Allokutzneria sp. A3M-2-11 16]MCP3801598.1 hypothetical protein [Allokutzneria sp. A3M-2-11 16]
MFNRLLFILPVAALLLSGCGDKTQPPAGAAPETTSAAAPTSKAKPGVDVKADVKITSCAANAWTQDVVIEVTNSSAEPAKYVVGVDISGPDGKPSSEARFVENRIEAGKTHTEKIPGDTPIKGAVTCAVGEARRLPAQ